MTDAGGVRRVGLAMRRAGLAVRGNGLAVRRVGLVAALVVVAAVSIQRVATRVFVLNFSLAGPNATALLVAGLVTGWTIPVAARLGWAHSLRIGAAALPFAVLGSAAGDPLLAGVGAVVALSLVTPWLVALGARDRAFVPGLAAGVAGVAALRGWLGTLPPYASLGGTALVLGVAFLVGALALQDDVPARGASAVAWLAVVAQGLFLAFPAATAAWAGLDYTWTLVASMAGVVVGATWATATPGPVRAQAEREPEPPAAGTDVEPRWRFGRRGVVVLAVAFALALGDVVWVGELYWVGVFLAQLAFVRLVAMGLGDDGLPWLVLAQTLAVLGVVAHVFATNWPFVPGGDALAGHAPLALFALASAPVVAVLLRILRRHRTPARADDLDRARSGEVAGTDEAAGTDEEAGTGEGGGASGTVTGTAPEVPDPGRRAGLTAIAPAALAMLSLAPDAIDDLVQRGAGAAADGSTDDDGPPYRALTLNVHQWVAGRGATHNYGAVRDLLASTRPHVVGLQETEGGRYTAGSANPVRWLADELDYHHVYGPPTRRGGYGVSLLSTYPILDAWVVSLPVTRSPPRWAVFATVDAPDGPLTVVSTHFQTDFHDADRQLAQAQTILGELVTSDTDRAVVLGDCNVEPGQDPAYERLARDLVDAWPAAGHDRRDGGGTYPAWDPRQRIDYVWLAGDWTVTDATRVGDASVSDHLGVLAAIDPDE